MDDDEYMNLPCWQASPELWRSFCNSQHRPVVPADHWTVRDVIAVLRVKGCVTCGKDGDDHDAK